MSNALKLPTVFSNSGIYVPAVAALDFVAGRNALLFQEGLAFLSDVAWIVRGPDLAVVRVGIRHCGQIEFTPHPEVRAWVLENRPDVVGRQDFRVTTLPG